MRFTPEYAQLQVELHSRGGYGVSGHKHADRIVDLARRMGTKSVLDYGCGQNTLAKALPFAIRSYDPFIEEFSAEPDPADIVVCSDMWEHLEFDCVEDVLQHIHSKTIKCLFVDVAVRLAKKTLADGRNAHLIIQPPLWWLNQAAPFFAVQSLQTYEGGFCAAFTPK